MTKPKTDGSSSKNNSISFLKESTNITNATSAPGNGEQQRLVSEAAYYRAMNRNFEGGNPVEDWLEAEKEVGTRLSHAAR